MCSIARNSTVQSSSRSSKPGSRLNDKERSNGRSFSSWALITGGGSGMGLEYARQLAAEGCGLALVSNRADELQAAKASIEAEFGVRVEVLDIDLCSPGAAGRVLEWCEAAGICPDILINNAGMFFMHYLGADNLAKASAMVDLHVKAVTELSVLFGSRMKELGRGHILNVASMTAWVPAPGIAVYSASKAYMVSFGKGLSYELRPYGVTVTTVCPAAIDTGLYQLSEKQRGWLRRLGILRSPEWLVRRALRGMKKGRRILRPGFGNHLVPFIVSLMPARLKDHLGMRWINR